MSGNVDRRSFDEVNIIYTYIVKKHMLLNATSTPFKFKKIIPFNSGMKYIMSGFPSGVSLLHDGRIR